MHLGVTVFSQLTPRARLVTARNVYRCTSASDCSRWVQLVVMPLSRRPVLCQG